LNLNIMNNVMLAAYARKTPLAASGEELRVGVGDSRSRRSVVEHADLIRYALALLLLSRLFCR